MGNKGGDLTRRGFIGVAALAGAAIATRFVPDAFAQDALPIKASGGAAQIYLLRGFADIFSAGLDEMSDELSQRGLQNTVLNHSGWESVANKIIKARADGNRGPVILIGHSLGANAVTVMAAELNERNIPVDLLVALAATAPRPLTPNVRRAVSYFYSHGGWGRPLVGGKGFRGSLTNEDFADVADAGHFSIDKRQAVQQEIIGMVTGVAG